MVRTFNLLRNVGKFDNVAAGAQLPLSRLTVIHAENARGKTTLAAILRSLASGRAEFVAERARLGAQHPPHVVVDTGAGAPAVFQNGNWSRTAPEIVIFDDDFVAENVCSGIEVGATHRQNLHELIVGARGIALTRALQEEINGIEITIVSFATWRTRFRREPGAASPSTPSVPWRRCQTCGEPRRAELPQHPQRRRPQLVGGSNPQGGSWRIVGHHR